MTDFVVENIVASAQVSNGFDIEILSEKMPGGSYNPDEFDGLTMKFDQPKVAVLVLSTGKLICTGGKSIEETNIAIEKGVKKIKDAGVGTKKSYNVMVENVIVSTDLKKALNLEHASKSLPLKNVDYKPKDFPGLIYRTDGEVILLFSSGRAVCTGAESIDEASEALKRIEEKLTSIGVL